MHHLFFMSRLSESLIEQYVRCPESLDAGTRGAVELQIRTDMAAREIADFYREYYRELRSILQDRKGPNGRSD